MAVSSTIVRDAVVARNPRLRRIAVRDDLALLRKMVETIGFERERAPRWSHVGACLGHGYGVSWAICFALALDPDEDVGEDRSGHDRD